MKGNLKERDAADLKANLTLIDLIVEDLTPTQSFVLGYLIRKKAGFDYDFLISMKEKTKNQFFSEKDNKPTNVDQNLFLDKKFIEKSQGTKLENENEGKENINVKADEIIHEESNSKEKIKSEEDSHLNNKNIILEENSENKLVMGNEEKKNIKSENEMSLEPLKSPNKVLEPPSNDLSALSKTEPTINLLKLPSYERKNPYAFHSINRFLKNNEKNANEEEIEDMNEKLSREYIKKMREEEEKEYKELMELRRQKDGEQMVCSICLEGLMEKDIFLLNNCSDIFHRECIGFYVKNEINNRKNIIICPDSQCKAQINIEELNDVLDQEDKENYYKYSLQTYVDTHAIDMSWCPTPDCQYAFYKLEEANDYDFRCPLCNQRYCLNCRVVYHRDQTCQEYRISHTRDANDEAFEKFVQGQKFKQCPKCHFWVEKNQGCDHMVCRCKFEFCYKCGGIFGKCLCVEKAQQRMIEVRERNQNKRMRRKKKKANILDDMIFK